MKKKELFNLRFQHVTGQLENPVKIREVKEILPELKLSSEKKNLKRFRLN